MSAEGRIGLRLSATLRREIEQAGPPSAATRALLILGLHAAGIDVAPYRAEALGVLPDVAPAVAAALERAVFNTRSTSVEQMLNATPAAVSVAVGGDLGDNDPFGNVGIDV